MTKAVGWFPLFLLVLLFCRSSFAQSEDYGYLNQTESRYWRTLMRDDVFTRIIGGRDAPTERFPYYVALLKQNQFVCGGSLIASDVVLTAAHCNHDLTHALVGKYSMRGGGNEITQRIAIETAYEHPGFHYESGRFDQMVLKLSEPSTLPYVNVNLESSVPDPDRDTITVIGLGRTEFEGRGANVLQELDVRTVSNDDCQKFKGEGYDYKNDIKDDMICIVGEDDTGQCNGDSGGPYVLRGESYSDDLQIGLVSWGARCSSTGAPGVGSRTSASDFIPLQTCTISDDPPPRLCRDFLSASPTESNAPSPSPSFDLLSLEGRGRLCSGGWHFCMSDEDCCSRKCASGVCRPNPDVVKRSVGRASGIRGGAAARARARLGT